MLESLLNEEAAIMATSAYHCRTLSSFQNMPDNVLREICLAFIGPEMPLLIPSFLPLPYTLMQISSGIRRIVLTTPSIWASINIRLDSSSRVDKLCYAALVCEASKWFERANGLSLSISVEDVSDRLYWKLRNAELDPANVLLDFLFSYSTRWKSICFHCPEVPIMANRIAALSAVSVPLLQSISLCFVDLSNTPPFINSTFLSIPTLKHLTLDTFWFSISEFTVDWALLTSLTLRGRSYDGHLSARDIRRILRQAKCLTFCDITVGEVLPISADNPGKIDLPFLKILHINEGLRTMDSGILSLIHAPNLRIFRLRGIFNTSTSTFFKRSPKIQELSLCFSPYEKSLLNLAESLYHCPSLTTLFLRPHWTIKRDSQPLDVNRFLKTFVQEDDVAPCPRLAYFTFEGSIDISLPTLRQFLEGKQRWNAIRNSLCPWKGVTIDLTGIVDTHVREQMFDLFSQKLQEGLNVGVFREESSSK